jgi:alpha-glucosidase
MSYVEPPSSISSLSSEGIRENIAALKDASGLPVEVSRIGDAWCIEVRYDLHPGSVRQMLTGAQEKLKRVRLKQEERGGEFVFGAGKEECVIHTDGSFSLSAKGIEYFRTSPSPFKRHAEKVEIYDSVMSLKVTDFANRAPFVAKGTTFQTHMTRFMYPRPEGLILGIPGQSGEMNRNGYRFELFNTDEFLHLPWHHPLYQAWPIVFHRGVNGGWVGIFHDNPSRTFIDVGDFYPQHVSFESVTGNTRVYVVHGKDLAEASHKMSILLGPSVFPPAWAFGYQQCRWSYLTSDEVRAVASRMRKEEIPCDAMYFDIDYMDGFRVFTRHPQTFPDLDACIRDLHAMGMKAVCILDPGVKVDPDYRVYKELLASGGYVMNATQDQPFILKSWMGSALMPDFTDPAVRMWWAKLQKEWTDETGFDGIWNDMNEPSNFDGMNSATSRAMTKRGPHENEYNLYGYQMSKASEEGAELSWPNKRHLVITRSGYAGVQQHAVIWHGDNCAWWEHLRLALDTAVQYSVAGAYYTGPDVPGFTGNPTDDLAVRFFQLGTFLPLYRGHSIYFAKDKEPYTYGPRANTLIKKAIQLRYSLLREWYSGFERSVRTSVPPLMPVLDEQGVLVRDHMLLFGKFLVAPVMDRDQTQKLVYLPKGSWYAFGDMTKRIRGGKWLSVPVTDETVPLYVKAGSIVTRNTVKRNVLETLATPETYDVYPDAKGNAEGYWYGDDGDSVSDPNAQRIRLRWDGTKVAKERL